MSMIEVPESAFIQCPAIRFGFRRVANCMQCQYHQGFQQVSENEAHGFFGQYRVICNHPIGRKMSLVELEDA